MMVVRGSVNVLHEKGNEMLLLKCCFSTVPVSEHVLPFAFPSFNRGR